MVSRHGSPATQVFKFKKCILAAIIDRAHERVAGLHTHFTARVYDKRRPFTIYELQVFPVLRFFVLGSPRSGCGVSALRLGEANLGLSLFGQMTTAVRRYPILQSISVLFPGDTTHLHRSRVSTP